MQFVAMKVSLYILYPYLFLVQSLNQVFYLYSSSSPSFRGSNIGHNIWNLYMLFFLFGMYFILCSFSTFMVLFLLNCLKSWLRLAIWICVLYSYRASLI